MKRNIIMDVDTGIDDALAIMLASRFLRDDVIGITTCGGNGRIEDTTRNTLAVAELIAWDVPVYRGAEKSSVGVEFVHAYDYHGTDCLCDVGLKTNSRYQDESAVDFIIRSARRTKDLEVLCLAAPTNLAIALKKDPEVARSIKAVYMMGGAFGVPGNQTEYAEYNFFQDPHALEDVLRAVPSVFIVPLDVTNHCCITDIEAEEIRPSSKIHSFVKEAIVNWYRFFGYPKKRQFELYDPLAAAALFEKDLISFRKSTIGVNTSGLRAGEVFEGGHYEVNIASSVKATTFLDFFKKEIIGQRVNDSND